MEPWKVYKRLEVFVIPQGVPSASICEISNHLGREAQESNMYEALKEMINLFNHLYAESMADNPDRNTIIDIATRALSSNSQIIQALNKAEGSED